MKSITILQTAGLRARLISYEPHCWFPEHTHSNIYVSYMLLGTMKELARGREVEFLSPHVAVLPPAVPHANLYGKSGAVLLVFDFCPAKAHQYFLMDVRDRSARRIDGPFIASLVQSLLNGSDKLIQDGLLDILSDALSDSADDTLPPPSWLRKARAYFDDAPDSADVAAVAADCGVHRSHLAKVFRAHLRMTPTQYRMQSLVARAVAQLLAGARTITSVAIDSGFADSAHFAREAKRRTGLTPRELRRLLGSTTKA